MKSGLIRITDNEFVEVGNFEYQIKYGNAEDPTTTRYETFSTIDVETFDSIIFDNVLNELCNIVYGVNYFFEFINKVVFIEIVKANNFIGEFQITFLDLNTEKLKCKCFLEIEPKFDVDSQYNLAELDEPYAEYPPKKNSLKEPKKEIAEWLMQEKGAVRKFLIQFDNSGSLEELKKHLSRATIYRHMKYCEEQGYIKDGKLVRKIHVVKPN